MSIDFASFERRASGWSVLATLVDADGSARRPFVADMSMPQATTRDLADAIHLLCALHGAFPSVIDHAVSHGSPEATPWLEAAASAFADERALLARLTAAAGPIPSTPGQALSEQAVAAQRHALDMLAQSDRAGCATGAAIALVLDWRAIRVVLENAAARGGFAPLHTTLPIDAETETVAATLALRPAVERAMSFGAQQLLAQHRALWDLAEARKSARDRS
jgi:hypothetical protein